jgi:hypothetical protein
VTAGTHVVTISLDFVDGGAAVCELFRGDLGACVRLARRIPCAEDDRRPIGAVTVRCAPVADWEAYRASLLGP